MKHSSRPNDKHITKADESVHPAYEKMVSALLAHMRDTHFSPEQEVATKLAKDLAQIDASLHGVLPNTRQPVTRCAIYISKEGEIEELNSAAVAQFDARSGQSIQSILIAPAQAFFQLEGERTSLIKLADRFDKPVVMIGVKETGSHRIVLVEADHSWPVGFEDRLIASYELTPRECKVLQQICFGATPAEISQESGRKIGTIRQQIKSILTKIEVNSQAQAVALVTSILVTIMGLNPLEIPTDTSSMPSSIEGANGKIGLSRFGLRGGLPVLFFQGALFGIASNGRDDDIAQTIGLDIWAPHRPGYGLTRIAKKRSDVVEHALSNALKVLDQGNISQAILLAHDIGTAYAFHFAARFPDRVAGIVCAPATPPMLNWEQTEQMPVRHRVNAWAAQQLPQIMDGIVSLGLAHIGSNGLKVIPEYVFADSKYDREEWQKPQYSSSISNSFTLVQQQSGSGFKFDMHLTNKDWSDVIKQVKCPVVLMHGEQNQTVSKEAVIAFGAMISSANVHFIKDAGHTMPLTHPANILREVSRLGIITQVQ